MLNPLGSQRGASLIELMVGLIIFGILLASAIPSFMTWIQNSQIRTGSESLLNGLQVARNEAVRRNANVEFQLDTGTGWTVRTVVSGETVQTAQNEGSSSVTLAVTPTDSTIITFTGLGRVASTNSDGSPPITQLNVDVPTSVLPAADSRDLRIVIGTGGQIRMCDPNMSVATDPRKC